MISLRHLIPYEVWYCGHRKHGASERGVGLSQLIQNREVIGVGDWY
jgi:hypothetical protein